MYPPTGPPPVTREVASDMLQQHDHVNLIMGGLYVAWWELYDHVVAYPNLGIEPAIDDPSPPVPTAWRRYLFTKMLIPLRAAEYGFGLTARLANTFYELTHVRSRPSVTPAEEALVIMRYLAVRNECLRAGQYEQEHFLGGHPPYLDRPETVTLTRLRYGALHGMLDELPAPPLIAATTDLLRSFNQQADSWYINETRESWRNDMSWAADFETPFLILDTNTFHNEVGLLRPPGLAALDNAAAAPALTRTNLRLPPPPSTSAVVLPTPPSDTRFAVRPVPDAVPLEDCVCHLLNVTQQWLAFWRQDSPLDGSSVVLASSLRSLLDHIFTALLAIDSRVGHTRALANAVTAINDARESDSPDRSDVFNDALSSYSVIRDRVRGTRAQALNIVNPFLSQRERASLARALDACDSFAAVLPTLDDGPSLLGEYTLKELLSGVASCVPTGPLTSDVIDRVHKLRHYPTDRRLTLRPRRGQLLELPDGNYGLRALSPPRAGEVADNDSSSDSDSSAASDQDGDATDDDRAILDLPRRRRPISFAQRARSAGTTPQLWGRQIVPSRNATRSY